MAELAEHDKECKNYFHMQYADTWSSNGTASVPQTSFYGLTPSTFQPVWDMWQKLVQPLVAQVPLLGCVGDPVQPICRL